MKRNQKGEKKHFGSRCCTAYCWCNINAQQWLQQKHENHSNFIKAWIETQDTDLKCEVLRLTQLSDELGIIQRGTEAKEDRPLVMHEWKQPFQNCWLYSSLQA